MASSESTFPTFVITTLLKYELKKCWKSITGSCAETCGYTGPGVGILLTIFIKHQIFNKTDLDRWIKKFYITPEIFSDIINETIGNLFDIGNYSPIANVRQGIRGLLVEDVVEGAAKMQTEIPVMSRVYQITPGGANLTDGPNIISFVSKTNLFDTFHHATLDINIQNQTCVIYDSWRIREGCRPLIAREHPLSYVTYYLDLINNVDIDISIDALTMIFTTLFLAPHTVRNIFIVTPVVRVVTVNPYYLEQLIEAVFTQVIDAARAGHRWTSYGGKFRKKRNKKTRKLNKKYKKYKKKHGNTSHSTTQ